MWYKTSKNNAYCAGAESKLFIFDIDETLFRTFAKIYVECTDGTQVVLDNQQLNSFDMDSFVREKQIQNPGVTCKYNFNEFKKSDLFVETSQPIEYMIKKLQKIQINFINKNKICGTDSKIILNTARGDFDNVELLKSFFASYGIDIAEIHLHRAGEVAGKSSGDRKNNLLEQRGLLNDNYGEYVFYDDSIDNLEKFLQLQSKYPGKKFIAKLVFPVGYSKQTTEVTLDTIATIRQELESAKKELHDPNKTESNEPIQDSK